ncbi:MAG: hydroxypyruvate isomerase [Dehalococcoidia bacterium]|nr:hydroxypyruvate isomerase [Dehalococcoidia bacterium]
MPKFSANLSMLFKEVEFLERFERAARAGFKFVEFMFPYEWEKSELKTYLAKNGLQLVLHNLPAGNWGAGERGLACLPDRVGEFRDGVKLAIEYATALGCPRLNCLAGIAPVTLGEEQRRDTLVSNVRYAAEETGKAGIVLMVEPINSVDMPGFCLNTTRGALELMRQVDHANLFIQYDVYHMQTMEGNLINTMKQNLSRIAHVQIADVPGRHEPGTGEINFDNLFRAIDEMGYQGWIGCEYIPGGSTEAGLGWVRKYL